MGVMQNVDRRTAVKWGILSAGFSFLANGVLSGAAAAQNSPAPAGQAKNELYEGANVPGGGQMDPRLSVSPYDPDPDIVEVAQRMSPFNPDSWHVEWGRVADKNEQLGEEFEKEGCKITANHFYLRAARFRQNSVIYLPESDPRMLPAYRRLAEVYEKAWKVVPPPFERLQIPYEGNTLPAYFSKPRGNPGQKFPTVISIGGADSVFVGNGSDYTARGMAFIFVDGPGQGQPLRFKKIYARPDSESFGKIVVDYLLKRPDVDAERIGITGGSMGGYTTPRICSGEKRIKACSMWSGAYSLVEDIFDYFPAIQDRLRWLCGARDLAEARKKMGEFTLEGRAGQIECPMFIGYSKDDRIMNPDGALKLYKAATRSERTVVEGTGHDSGRIVPQQRTKAPREILMADWMGKRLGAIA